MANEEHLRILKRGVESWNRWRLDNPTVEPDLSETTLENEYLHGIDFRGANLTRANLKKANLRYANFGFLLLNKNVYKPSTLTDCDLRGARLETLVFVFTDLTNANFSNAALFEVIFDKCFLNGAKLNEAELVRTRFINTLLSGADFTNTRMADAVFTSADLSKVKGLETIIHRGPSSIGLDTLYKSGGNIPELFLRGCGVPDEFITFLPSTIGAQQAIQFYSCFVSYSTKDEEFAERLHSRMRDNHLRVWFAPEDIKGGQKIHEQLERAIQVHDRLLIVLSESSMQSEWVMTEIRNARQAEIIENRRKLFPIRLVDFDAIRKWKCFDADTGKDLAVELREYFIPDFSNWKEHDSFEAGFARLLHDLKAE